MVIPLSQMKKGELREVKGWTLREWHGRARCGLRVGLLPCGTYSQICLIGRHCYKADIWRVLKKYFLKI